MVSFATFKPDIETNMELINKFDQRMAPGCASEVGFRGVNETLRAICIKDSECLKEKNITHEQIADRLETIIKKVDFLRECHMAKTPTLTIPNIIIENTFRVESGLQTNGYQECPFSEGRVECGKGRGEYTITNMKSKEQIKVSNLLPHLIREHHFFEGDVEYRLDPGDAIRVLELQPGISYKNKTEEKGTWEFDGSPNCSKELYMKFKEHGERVLENEEVAAFLLPAVDIEKYLDRGFTHREKIIHEGKEQNKTEWEIEVEIKKFIEHEKEMKSIFSNDKDPLKDFTSKIDDPIWVPKGKSYLHLFFSGNHQSLFEGKESIEIGKHELLSRYCFKGYSVFIAAPKVVPVLIEGDRIEQDDCIKNFS